ncbi:MAG: hypothetical protein QOH63_62 [Acidobacteriota bacterium]|jgi:hypothetical protein|nr:hypothetical protein [Acidobacteriota bacterium]
MNVSVGSTPIARHGERGSARIRFIVVLAVIAIIAYIGFQYVPVAYHAYTFKRTMDEVVEKAASTPGSGDQKGQWVVDQLRASEKDYDVPPNAKISPAFTNGRVQVTVQFTQPINLLPGFTYQYNFDYTAKSSTFLNPQ